MWQGSKKPLCRHCEIEKTLKNMGNGLAKIVNKSIFNEMRLADLLIKKHGSF